MSAWRLIQGMIGKRESMESLLSARLGKDNDGAGMCAQKFETESSVYIFCIVKRK